MQSQKFKIHVSPTYAIVKFKLKMEAHLKCIHQIIKRHLHYYFNILLTFL